MQIITTMDFQLNNTAVCIGKFDGIHRGHRMLIQEAEKTGLTMVMFTFIFPSGQTIYSYEEKVELARELGIDVLIACRVTEEFMCVSAQQFVEEYLVSRCDVKKVVVGADFRFGYQRQGNAQYLKQAGATYGFETVVFEKLCEQGEVISSTRIRRELAIGNMSEVNELLQTPYFIYGTVEKGNQIGRKIEVPTANIYPKESKVLPPYGVYASYAQIEDKTYAGVCNLGVKPTVPGENKPGLEIWLFDYNGDLYGKKIRVSLIEFQRSERKFDSLDELKVQIVKDTAQAKKILAVPVS